jgi:hypothetical protein
MTKAGIAEPEYTFIARQRLGKQVPAKINTHCKLYDRRRVIVIIIIIRFPWRSNICRPGLVSVVCKSLEILPFVSCSRQYSFFKNAFIQSVNVNNPFPSVIENLY